MKNSNIALITALAVLTVLGYSCKKSANSDLPIPTNDSATGIHNYGLLPMQPEQWADVPSFSASIFSGKLNPSGLTATTLPGSYLLASPAVRDQGQIGSCTGFCGAETNEILDYYKANLITSPTLTTATGVQTAAQTQFVNPSSLFGQSSALSPLFIYYVERCVILKESITADKGAYMVNIPQTLQGLTNNSGTGVTLKGSIGGTIYSFAGDCSENYYPYPSNGSSTSKQYRTAPSSTAISNANSFTIGIQNGSTDNTNNTGVTNHGYYVINNTTDPVVDVKTAIVNNKPVMMGFNVYDNASYSLFETLNTTRYTYNPLTSSGQLMSGARLLGGHAVPIIGYVDDSSQPGGGLFICENSWNTTWGYYGYFYLPYAVLRSTTVVPAGNLYVAIL